MDSGGHGRQKRALNQMRAPSESDVARVEFSAVEGVCNMKVEQQPAL
jgi:hypothetical protein